MYITSKNVRPARLDLGDISYISAEIHAEIFRRCPVRYNDVLYVKDGANAGTAAINTIREPYSLLSSVALIRPKKEALDPRYLVQWLNDDTTKSVLLGAMSGSAIRRFVLRDIRRFLVPLPPLEEQRRIADILDKADAIRRKRKQAIALTEDLLRSTFLEMFGDPVTNPKHWPIKPLAQLTDLIDYGVTASACAEPTGPKFLRITDIQNNRVDWTAVPFCECDQTTAQRALLKSGDIVFARTGATTGKSFWIRDCPNGAVFASYLIRVRPGSQLVSGYLSEFFQSTGYWSQIRAMAEGAAQPGVNATKLGALQVPVPPIEHQQKIAAVLAVVLATQARGEAAVHAADKLFDSLVHKAFRGELTAPTRPPTSAVTKGQLHLFPSPTK